MNYIHRLRHMARVWFVVALLAAGMLTMFSLESHAQTPPVTETGSGGGDNVGQNRTVLTSNQPGQKINAEQFIDFLYSQTIRREIEEGKRKPILGRDDEVIKISNGLDDLNRVVAIQGDSKSGRSSAVEQYIYLNPGDTVYRVKSKELSEVQPPSERARLMNEIIAMVETRAKAQGSHGRVVMYVDNLPLLDIGHLADYKASKSIVAGIAREHEAGYLLETNARTLALMGEENPNFKAVTRVVEMTPAEVLPILDYLRRERTNLQNRARMQFTEVAMMEAARQAARHFANDPFNAAQRLLLIASRELHDVQAGSPTALARANQELSRLKLEIDSLQADLKTLENVETRKKLAAKLDQHSAIETKIAGLKGSAASLSNPIADTQRQLENLKQQMLELRLPWHNGWLGKPEAQRVLETNITNKAAELEALKNAKAAPLASGPAPARLTPDYIHIAAAQETGLSIETVSMDIEKGTARLNEINEELFGNEERVERVKKRMARYIKEMEEAEEERQRNPKKEKKNRGQPIQSILSMGPTGTGKTDLYLKVAAKLGMPIVKIDMTNYSQQHHGSGLIGAKPEYVGFGQPGELTGPVLKTPYVMIILDEITRAHINVIKQVIYPILDVGMIKDSEGRTVSFEKAFIVGTSNAGEHLARMPRAALVELLKSGVEKEWSAKDIEAKPTEELRIRAMEWELKNTFMWEESMVGRWGQIEVTAPHSREVIEKIAHKQVKSVINKFANRKIKLVFTEKALKALIDSYDPTKGARSLLHAFENSIHDKVYELYIDGHVKAGEVLVFDHVNGAYSQIVTTDSQLTAAKNIGDPIAAERRSRMQQALARQQQTGAPTREYYFRFFDEAYMVHNAVAKALRGFGRK